MPRSLPWGLALPGQSSAPTPLQDSRHPSERKGVQEAGRGDAILKKMEEEEGQEQEPKIQYVLQT